MKNLALLFIGVIGLTIIGLTMMNPQNLGDKPSEVIVEVDYTRRWIGSITVNGIPEAWQGDGSASQTVLRPQNTNKWVVGVSAQKLDGSRDVLTLRIKNSKGDLLEMLSTTAPYELIAIAVSL